MDMESKVVDDVSYILHLEATGDSEAGYFDPAMSVVNHADDDDAESCSCGTTSDFLHVVRVLNYGLQDKANVGDDHQEDEEDGEVVEQKKVHLTRNCRDDQSINEVVTKENKMSSAVSVDSTKTMNEMEKSRLFWEACLAS